MRNMVKLWAWAWAKDHVVSRTQKVGLTHPIELPNCHELPISSYFSSFHFSRPGTGSLSASKRPRDFDQTYGIGAVSSDSRNSLSACWVSGADSAHGQADLTVQLWVRGFVASCCVVSSHFKEHNMLNSQLAAALIFSHGVKLLVSRTDLSKPRVTLVKTDIMSLSNRK